MSLEGEYNAALLTELLIEELKDGSIPTLELLTDELDNMKQAQPLLGERPMFSLEDNSVEFYENASASKTNDTFERYSKDVQVMWDTITRLKRDIIKNARRWATSYETTKRFLEQLEDRIDNLLLLNSDTLGYYQFVSDDFLTTEFVDLEETDALVDTGTGTVTIAQETTATGDETRVNLSALVESDITFNITEAVGLQNNTLGTDSVLLNAITDEYSTWLSYVTVTTQAPITGALTIDLKETKTVNKVIFKANGSTATSAFVVTAMYSADGVDYLVVPTDGSTQSILDSATWVFPDIEARYFKFLITKNGADDKSEGTYTYEFGAKNISFYEAAYDTSSGHSVVSAARSVLGEDGEPIEFTKAVLSACEQVPEGTSIHYSLGVDGGSVFIPIDPIERSDPSRPQVLDFNDLIALTNEDSTSVWDDTNESDALHFDTVASFNLVNESDALLNWYIQEADVGSLNEGSIVIWRNAGTADDPGVQVRGIARGWGYDAESNNYSTVVRIDNPNGLTLDFGTTSITINGVVRTGAYTLTQGIHEITTSAANWLAVESDLTTLEALKAADLLYPYNHKLLIEGYAYSTSFSDEQKYIGTALWAEMVCMYVTTHTFNTQTDTDNITVYTRDVDDDGKLVFVFKVDRSFSDHANERILVEYKLANKTFTNVVFKAVLTTTDESLTPVLDAYVIKLG
ncbi:MAG: discoidin domain-containing protein [Candidatus Thorarchaeota archaeon]|jgi:hypothetical protein